jgi:hypothetical protein
VLELQKLLGARLVQHLPEMPPLRPPLLGPPLKPPLLKLLPP